MKTILDPQSKVVAINTFGGSILYAANARGFAVRGGFQEDTDRGRETSELSWGVYNLLYKIAEWRTRDWDLDNTIVVANNPQRDTIKWALDCGADSAAVHYPAHAKKVSHPRLLGDLRGYNYYRLDYNACTFGLPIWQRGTWIVFVRRDVLSHDDSGLMLNHIPQKVLLGSVSYLRITGYPDDYRLVEGVRVQTQLAGVPYPPVVSWILESLERIKYWPRSVFKTGRGSAPRDGTFRIPPDDRFCIAPTKKIWEEWPIV